MRVPDLRAHRCDSLSMHSLTQQRRWRRNGRLVVYTQSGRSSLRALLGVSSVDERAGDEEETFARSLVQVGGGNDEAI